MLSAEIDAVTIHICTFGMTGIDEKGEAPVQKATRIMSSIVEILKRINRQYPGCSRHAHLIQGRARAAQVCPREFGLRVCEGIATQKKLDMHGLGARPLMSIDEMKTYNQDQRLPH